MKEAVNKVTIAKILVELESKKDKESRGWKLDRATTSRSDVPNSIIQAHKFVKREVTGGALATSCDAW